MAKIHPHELSDEILKNFPQFFAQYSKIDKRTPAVWFYWSDKTIKNQQFVCHSPMGGEQPGWDHLITAVPNSEEPDIAYQRMLMNGPFKGFSDLIHLGCLDKNYYIHCAELGKWPANVLYNYCIATRIPIEAPGMTKYWLGLCEKGFDPVLAFLLTTKKGGFHNNSNHFWWDTSSDWSRIISGKMTNMSADFKTKPTACRPTNVIWGRALDCNRSLQVMSAEAIAEKFNLPVKKPEAYTPPLKTAGKKLQQIPAFGNFIPIIQNMGQAVPVGHVFHMIPQVIHDEVPVHWNAVPQAVAAEPADNGDWEHDLD